MPSPWMADVLAHIATSTRVCVLSVHADDCVNFSVLVSEKRGHALTFCLQSTGLSPSVDDRDFRQYFEAFGTITDCQIMLDHNAREGSGL